MSTNFKNHWFCYQLKILHAKLKGKSIRSWFGSCLLNFIWTVGLKCKAWHFRRCYEFGTFIATFGQFSRISYQHTYWEVHCRAHLSPASPFTCV